MSLKIGQRIEGKVGTYIISKQLHKDVWAATYQASPPVPPTFPTLNSASKLDKVIIKAPPKSRLDNERNVLQHFHGL